MTSMNGLVDAVLAEVYGYSTTVDPETYLTTSVDEYDLQFRVADASRFSIGIVQIDDELILLDGADRDADELSCGNLSSRGIRGSTAASHAVGARVTMNPSIPRLQAKNAVLQTLTSSTGLFAVGSTSFTFSPAVGGYALPSEAKTILSASWKPSGPVNIYHEIRNLRHDKFNNQINILEGVQPGRTVYVKYTKDPDSSISWNADFTSTGLPASCEDVIRFGAAWRLCSFLEPMSLLGQTAEADAMDRQNTPGSRIRVGQYLYQIYKAREAEEVRNLQEIHPIRVRTGR